MLKVFLRPPHIMSAPYAKPTDATPCGTRHCATAVASYSETYSWAMNKVAKQVVSNMNFNFLYVLH